MVAVGLMLDEWHAGRQAATGFEAFLTPRSAARGTVIHEPQSCAVSEPQQSLSALRVCSGTAMHQFERLMIFQSILRARNRAKKRSSICVAIRMRPAIYRLDPDLLKDVSLKRHSRGCCAISS
jgi:hypothetical protein